MLADVLRVPIRSTNLEESKFVGGIGRADNNCFHVADVDVAAGNGEGYSKLLLGPYQSIVKPC